MHVAPAGSLDWQAGLTVRSQWEKPGNARETHMEAKSGMRTKQPDSSSVLPLAQVLLSVWCVVILLVGMVGWLAWQTLETVRDAGSLSDRLSQTKDLIADVLPPPAYLVEPWAIALHLVGPVDEAQRAHALTRLRQLRQAFDERIAFWSAHLSDEQLREALAQVSASGLAFWDTLERRVVPALHERRDAKARHIVVEELTAHYDRHRAAIDDVVRQARAASTELERRTASTLLTAHQRLAGLFVGAVLSVVLVGVAAGRLLARRALALRASLNAERTAQEALVKLARAVESTQDAVIITDHRGVIEYVNAAFTAITGYTAQEAIGNTPGKLIKSGEQDQAFYQMLWERILSGETFHGVLTNKRRSGALYVASETISPIKEDDGTITHFVAVQRDITEQRKLEARLQQAAKLEAVGQLAGGIAHDFNNLLTAILGFVELLKPHVPVTGQSPSYLEAIEHTAKRAAALTRQLLTFSRRQTVERQILDVNHVLTECEALLKRTLDEQIVLHVVPNNQTSRVKADPAQLETVLLNLAINARDAMPDGGRLLIEASNVELEPADVAAHPGAIPGPYVRLTITDSGIGIPPELMPRLFEPFFTTKPPGKGTGLGLALVREVMTQAGGFVEVESRVGHGTRFTLYLPRCEEAGRHDVDSGCEAEPQRGSETLLVVEDEHAIRQLAVTVLTELGYTVLEAADGQAALEVAQAHQGPIDALITDIVLPKLNGREVARALRKARPALKVLFVSGYPVDPLAPGDIQEAVLPKPYTPSVLARHLRALLDRH